MKQLLLTLLIGLFSINLFAQQPPPMSPQMQSAAQLVREQKWTEAVTALEAITKSEANNGRAWFLLGTSYHQLKQYEKAVEAYEKNIPISKNPNAMYNLACAYSRLKNVEKAFEWLEKSIQGGVFGVNLQTDEDLSNLRSDARFAKLADALDRQTRPCIYQPESKQFDFWLGDWDVFNTSGQKVGTNLIQSFSEGCALMENWTASVGGSNGKSINYYDASTGKWYQHWIGSGGGALRYEGSFKDNAMRYEGFTIGQDGKKTLHKLTFFKIDENTVRQLAESSADDGKSWNITYDFKYVRKK